MNTDRYAELLKVDPKELLDCGVYFIDEHTSMLYCVVENFNNESPQTMKHIQYQNYIVFMDTFDSFITKLSLFESISQRSP